MFSSYAIALNKQEGRIGSLFQKRFKRVSLNTEYRIWHNLAYLHHNPIHHKFVNNYEEWKYSSYKTFISQRPTLLARNQVLSWFNTDDNTQAKLAFIDYHQSFKINLDEDYLE